MPDDTGGRLSLGALKLENIPRWVIAVAALAVVAVGAWLTVGPTQHPGPFKWWYGARLDSCTVEVWRQWPDGCQHKQNFDTCHGVWLGLTWTNCVH